MSEPSTKVCKDCQEPFPATKEYFYFSKLAKGFAPGSYCKTCHNARNKSWAQDNPKKLREYSKAHYERNLEKELQRRRDARAADPEKHRAKVRKSHAKYKDKRIVYRAEYIERPGVKERINQLCKLRRIKKPILHKEQDAKKRAIKLGVAIHESISYSSIYKRDRGTCHVCGLKVTKKTLVFDHIIPMSCGGPHSAENIKVAHYVCNRNRLDGRKNK